MWKVKIKNIVNQREYQGVFKTEPDATSWIQQQENKQSWGRKARQAVRGMDSFDESLVLSEFEDTDRDGTVRTIVSLKKEYEITGPTLIDGSGNTTEDRKIRVQNVVKSVGIVDQAKKIGEIAAGYFSVLVAARGLTKAQKKTLRKNAEIKSILDELRFGSLDGAVLEMDAMTPDEVTIFQEDIDSIKQFIADASVDLA